MLEAAQTAKDNGIDVVVGYIEPHARVETMNLVHGLECLTPKLIKYNQIQLKEFNIE